MAHFTKGQRKGSLQLPTLSLMRFAPRLLYPTIAFDTIYCIICDSLGKVNHFFTVDDIFHSGNHRKSGSDAEQDI